MADTSLSASQIDDIERLQRKYQKDIETNLDFYDEEGLSDEETGDALSQVVFDYKQALERDGLPYLEKYKLNYPKEYEKYIQNQSFETIIDSQSISMDTKNQAEYVQKKLGELQALADELLGWISQDVDDGNLSQAIREECGVAYNKLTSGIQYYDRDLEKLLKNYWDKH